MPMTPEQMRAWHNGETGLHPANPGGLKPWAPCPKPSTTKEGTMQTLEIGQPVIAHHANRHLPATVARFTDYDYEVVVETETGALLTVHRDNVDPTDDRA